MLSKRGIVAGSYDGCEMCQVAAMLGANEPDPDAAGEVIGDPTEFLPPGWVPQ